MGMFDDLISSREDKGGKLSFDDLVPANGGVSALRSRQAQAGTRDVVSAPRGQEQGLFSGLLTGFENVLTAAGQGTNPNVYHGDGHDLRRRIGDVVEGDDRSQYALVDGKPIPVDPKRHVILKDPASGNLVAFERDATWDEGPVSGFSRIASQGLLTGPVTGPQRGVGAAAATTRAAQRADAIDEAAGSFERLGVRPFGPAFNEGPIASVAKQLSETPVIGSPIRQNLQESIEGVGRAANRIADEIAPAATHDLAGARLQGALDRFSRAGVDQVEPPQLRNIGVPPARVNRPMRDVMSAGAAQDMATAQTIREQIGAFDAQTTRGVTVPSAKTRNQTLAARTTSEDLSDQQLQSVIRAPSRDTSFGARSEALYERASRMVPAMMRENNSANPNMVAAVNTRQMLQQVEDQIANQISGQGVIAGPLAERLRNARASNFPLSDLMAIRTEVGRALGNTNPLQQTLSRGQLNGLYAAISRDIEIGLETLANRAAIGTTRSNNQANYVTPEMARQAGGALRAFRTADRYFRQGMEAVERFNKVVGTDNPTQAVGKLLSAAKGRGKGNLQLLRTARNALRDNEWADIQALLVRTMGDPAGSVRGMAQDTGFSVQTFLTNWQNMEPAAIQMLFGGEHAQAINDLVRVVDRLANVEALSNTSRTGTNTLNVTGTVGAMSTAAAGDFVTPLMIGGSGYAASALMARPEYTRWLTGYLRLRAAGGRATEGQMVAHVNRLWQLARNNPQLLPAFEVIAQENGITEAGQGDDQ